MFNPRKPEVCSIVRLSFRYLSLLIFFGMMALQALAQPSISSFSPASGPVGTAVTITGSNFSSIAASNTVYFGGVKATVTAASASSLTVTVPTGANYKPITVTVNNLTAYSRRPFLVSFPGSETLSATSFEYAVSVNETPNLETNDLDAADFDGDGKVDIVVVDRIAQNVTLYRNTSTAASISFQVTNDFFAGGGSYYLEIADMDGDGKLDIVTGNKTGQSISVLRNLSTPGNISFAAPVFSFMVSFINDVVSGDFDGDGKTDIAVANSDLEGTICLLRNTSIPGTISFATRVDLPIQGVLGRMAVGDIDNDGKSDLAIANFGLNVVSVLRNTSSAGSFAFGPKVNFPTGQFPDGIALGDLDGDGKPELAVANKTSGTLSVYQNTSTAGATSFAVKVDHAVGSSCDDVAINDLDGDGKADLAATNNLEGFSLFKNNSTAGNIVLGARLDYTALLFPGISTADFDGNGQTDIFHIAGIFRVSVWKNKKGQPQIASFAPTAAGAGATITITGKNFTGITAVSFGGTAATSFTVVNATTITAVVGTGATGNIKVVSPSGDANKGEFTFIPPPVIFSFDPLSAASGATITINGQYLTGASAVSFGGVPATSFTVINDQTIEAVVPSSAVSGSIMVTATGGTVSTPGFVYLPPPVITSFTPTSGLSGTVVTITGSNFTGLNGVSFGGVPALSATPVNSTTITAVVGDGASGAVTITTDNGTASLAGFTHLYPTISSFTPTSGLSGTVVTISGTNFIGASSVSFGGTAASSFTVVNGTTITAMAGLGSSGNVTVVTPVGTATKSGFTHTGPPVISSFTPTSGGPGTLVTISGLNFTGATAINFGGTAANSFTVVNGNTITAIVGNGASGSLSITTANGTVSAPGFIFTQIPKITSFSPIMGQVGTVVTINGQHFDPDIADNIVFFGSVRATVTSATATTITTIVPAGASYYPVSVLTNKLTAYSRSPFTVTFANNGLLAFDESSFAFKTKLPLDAMLREVAVADFDADQKPDIAVVNQWELGISVLKNTSVNGAEPSFAGAVNLVSSIQNYGLGIADLDGDGKQDIYAGGQNLSLFRNTSSTGIVSFAPVFAGVSTGATPGIIITEDIDQDGRPDIISAQNTSEFISINRNTSYPGMLKFDAPLQYTASVQRFNDVAAADMDGDGKPDVVALGNDGKVHIYRNNSTPGIISLAAPVSYTAGFGAFAVGDLDGDNKPDIAVSAFNGSDMFLLLNTSTAGAISMTGSSFVANIVPTSSIKLADLNGDGRVEMAVSDGPRVKVFNNLSVAGSIVFAPFAGYLGSNGFQIALNDLNADGRPELISSMNDNGESVIIHKNQVGVPAFVSFSPASATTGVAIEITGANLNNASAVSFGGTPAASFTNNSGTSITAVVGLGASGNLTVTTPLGTLSLPGFTFIPGPLVSAFTPATGIEGTVVTITGTDFTAVTGVHFGGAAAASFTVNSSTSITAIVGGGSTGSVSVTNAVGTGSKPGFTYTLPPAPIITSFSPRSGPVGTIVTITGNNFNPVASENIVYFGAVRAPVSAATATSLTVTAPAGATYNKLIVINNANRLSDAVPNSFILTRPSVVSAFVSTAVEKKYVETVFQTNLAPRPLALADFDGDGKTDIAQGGSVHRNLSTAGTILFTKEAEFSTTFDYPVINDFNGDGKMDILLGSKLSLNTSALGSISFAAQQELNIPGGDMGDVDDDGRPDLLALVNGKLSVFRNTTVGGNISFSDIPDYSIASVNFYFAHLADVDKDGKLDITVMGSNPFAAAIYRNTTVGGLLSFAAPVSITIPIGSSLLYADLYPGSKSDMILANASDNKTISVIQNTSTPGNISFGNRLDLLTAGLSQFSISIGDFDSDGKPDIAVANGYTASAFSLFKNRSSNTTLAFDAAVNYGATSFGSSVAFGDIDLDGKTDFTGSYNYEMVVFKNTMPSITSFTPTTGGPTTVVTITGADFTGVTGVSFGGTMASSFTIVSPTTITAVVGNGASGDVTVLIPGGGVTLPGFTYNPPTPVIDIDNEVFTTLTLTPNPTRDRVEVKHPSMAKAAFVRIVDLYGRTVRVYAIPRNTKRTLIFFEGLPAAVYEVVWTDGKDVLRQRMLIH